jgi:hypothetical protein
LEENSPQDYQTKTQGWVASSKYRQAQIPKEHRGLNSFIGFYPKIQNHEFSVLPQSEW